MSKLARVVVVIVLCLLITSFVANLHNQVSAKETVTVVPTNTKIPTSTSTPLSTNTNTPTATRTPTTVPTPTATPMTLEELKAYLGVTVVKYDELDDKFVRYTLDALKADQDYLIRHGVVDPVFSPFTLKTQSYRYGALDCNVDLKNGRIVMQQNIAKCYDGDLSARSWYNNASHEGMHVYMQFSLGVVPGSKLSTVTWIWIEGGASYFGWQALYESKLATPKENYRPIRDELLYGYYTPEELLDIRNFGPGDGDDIGYQFFDWLIHKDGDDQAGIDRNIQKVYEVFRTIGAISYIPDNPGKRQAIMNEAVQAVFGVSAESLYADFIEAMKK